MPNAPIDLKARARQAMIEAGFQPDFPAEVIQTLNALKQNLTNVATAQIRDLRSLLWSSIDNDTSKDLDQIEYVEKLADGTCRLLIGIADVDSAVSKGVPADIQASRETTSVYTGVTTFPMLPAELSTDLTSLLDAQDRRALVIELHVLQSGDVAGHSVYPALVRNRREACLQFDGGLARRPWPDACPDCRGTRNGTSIADATGAFGSAS